jgi:hypothetical protein
MPTKAITNVMKTLIALLLSCTPLLGADTDMQVTSTLQTNAEKNLILAREVFTRAGQTNLTCVTIFRAGKFEVRQQEIYHGGIQLVSIAQAPDLSLTIRTSANSPYSVIFGYRSSNELRTIGIWTTNNVLVDSFKCKGGVISPEESSAIGGKLPQILHSHF